MSTALGCGTGKPATPGGGALPPRVFVGEVTGTDVRLAVIATARRARIYFCGGNSTYATATRWLAADLDTGQRLTLQAPQNWQLDGQLVEATLSGTIDMGDGVSHPFAAAGVGQGTIAGLYEATAPCGKVGLIVAQLSPASDAIGQGACIGETPAQVMQVNPVMPLARLPDGTIPVTTAGTTDPTLVHPATPPAD
jgi:hypothetical protein